MEEIQCEFSAFIQHRVLMFLRKSKVLSMWNLQKIKKKGITHMEHKNFSKEGLYDFC